MRRGDRMMLRILLVILITGGVLWGTRYFTAGPEAVTAEISRNGQLIQKLLLKKGDPPKEFTVEFRGGFNRLMTEDGGIAVVDADCPDRDCVKRGWLRRPGDSAVCLPNRLVIRISGKTEVDGVTW